MSSTRDFGNGNYALRTIAVKPNGEDGDTAGFGYETLTVSTTALGGTAAVYAPADEDPATVAVISVESNGIRFRYDGGTPTSAIGHALSSGATYELLGADNIANLRMIRSGGADATVHLTYER